MAEDTLASVGEKVTDVFVHAFATGKPNSSLVFLPFALSTPDDIVQEGVVNQTRLASFLRPNFDAPYLMSPSQYSVNGRDLYYGTASQIYQLAVSTARPTAAVGSDAWNGVFLADPNWCVPGMSRGGLLPAPAVAVAEGQDPLIYGIPTDIVVVKDLNISVKWSDQDRESLNGNDFIGPFSLAGASATTAPDGTWNYSRPEMQIVALLCRHLPVLPPADSPDVLPPATTGTSTPSSPADSSPTSPPASDGAGGS